MYTHIFFSYIHTFGFLKLETDFSVDMSVHSYIIVLEVLMDLIFQTILCLF